MTFTSTGNLYVLRVLADDRIINMKSLLLFFCLVALFFSGCVRGPIALSSNLVRANGGRPIQGPAEGPAISFTASATSIFAGQMILLTWSSPHASTVTLNGAPVERWGSENVFPGQTTTYTIEAQDSVGANQASTTIVVNHGIPDVDFMGDSLTSTWVKYVDFPANQWLNGGVPGQTCANILARFQNTIIKWPPKTVHIMCGTNDIWHQSADLATTESDITQMLQIAQARHVRVILATIPYIRANGVKNPALDSLVDQLNQWIKGTGLPVADYHAVMTTSEGEMDMRYSDDGVHPNAAGYSRMMPVTTEVLSQP